MKKCVELEGRINKQILGVSDLSFTLECFMCIKSVYKSMRGETLQVLNLS